MKEIPTQMLPIGLIEPNKGQIEGLPKNPRLIRDEHFKKLKKSIEDNPEMLYLRELLVYPHQGKYVVIGGNMRLMAMKDLGYTEAPCKVIPEDTTVEQLKAYTIKDNAAYGEWDYDLLANEWDAQDLDDWCVDVWQDINDEHKEPETQEDDFDEETADIPPVSKAGDIFQLGNHILMCGDSTNPDDVARLMDGQQADMVFTDPPYGVSYVGTNNPNGKEWKMIENDDLRGDKLYQFLKAAFQNIAEHLKRGGAFYIWFASVNHIQFETAINVNGLRVKQELIWDKGMVLGHSDYHWAYEPCLYGCHQGINSSWYGDRSQKTFIAMNRTDIRKMTKDTMQDILLHLHEGRSVWQVKRDAVCDYVHPTQKPIALAGIGIKNSTAKGHIVLDLFGGSGSTLMAAEQLQRKARVMEYDPHYVDCIIARWEQFTGQKAKLLTNTKTAEP